MKRILFTIVMLWSVAYGQSTIYLRGDTVRIQKGGGNGELFLENSTRNVTGGVLTNIGGGRTGFVMPSGGGSSDSTLQQITNKGNKTTNTVKIVKKDSVGEIFNHNWGTGSFGTDLADNTGTATLTASSGKTTVNGTLGFNLINYITYNQYLGVENFTITPGGFVVTQKNNTSYGFGIRMQGTVGSAPDIFFHFYLTDTSQYIAFTTGASLPVYNTSANTRSFSTFKFTVGDTLYPIISKVNRKVTAVLRNNRTKSEMQLDIAECFATVGVLSVYFYSQQDIVGNLKINFDEVYHPSIAWLGDSNMWGVASRDKSQTYVSQVMGRVGGSYVLMAAPFETALDGTYRLYSLGLVLPRMAIWGYGVNQDVNIDSFSKRTCRFVEFCLARNIDVGLLGLIPQTASNVTTRNDTLIAIASRYPHTKYIDISNPIMGSSGTAMDAIYNSGDNVHINAYGHDKAASVIGNSIPDSIIDEAPFIASPMPIGYNPPYMVGVDIKGHLTRIFPDSINKFVQNITPIAGISNAQRAGINAIGSFVFNNSGGFFYVLGNGNFANPNFKIENGEVRFGTNVYAGNFSVISSQPNFNGGSAIWSGGIVNLSTSPITWMINNPNGNGITDGFTIDNNTANPTNSTYNILRLRRNGTDVAKFTRDGGGRFNDTLSYSGNYGSSFGTHTLVDKNYVDSVAAAVVAGGGGLSNPMTTTGDMIKGASSGTPARLGIGSTNDVLRVVAGVPAWTTNTLIENQNSSAQSARSWVTGTVRSDSSFRGRTTGAIAAGNTGAISAFGASGNGRVETGFDVSSGLGWIQAYEPGVAYNHLLLQPGDFNVGIGTDLAPSVKLHIRKSNFPAIRFEKTGIGSWYICNGTEGTNNDFKISWNTTDHVTVLLTGEVGIGTSTPREVLDVNGKLSIRTIGLGTVSGSDTVLWVKNGRVTGSLASSILTTSTDTSGVWTPTATPLLNTTSVTSIVGHFIRKNNEVSFSITMGLTPTSASGCSFSLSMPFASNFTSSTDAVGTGIASFASSNEIAYLEADATGDIFQVFTGNLSSTSARIVSLSGHYTIK